MRQPCASGSRAPRSSPRRRRPRAPCSRRWRSRPSSPADRIRPPGRRRRCTGSPRSRSGRSATATATSATRRFAGVASSASPTRPALQRLVASIDPRARDAHRSSSRRVVPGEADDDALLGHRRRRAWPSSVTTTLNDSFGNARVAPGLGFLWNNEMDDFATRPGEQNMYGLVQGEVNAVAPGKRMLSSMCPSIAVVRSAARFACGARPAASTIPTTNLQVLLDRVLRGGEPRRRRRGAALPPAGPARRDPDREGPLRRRLDRGARGDGPRGQGQRRGPGSASRPRPRGRGRAGGSSTAVADPRRGGARRLGRRRPGAVTRLPGRLPAALPRGRGARACSTSGCSPARRSGCARRAPEIAVAIRDMAVRGAPAIGVAAAYGAAFSLRSGASTPPAERFGTARRLLAGDAADRRQPLRGARAHGDGASRACGGRPTRSRSSRRSSPRPTRSPRRTSSPAAASGASARSCSSGERAVLTHCNAGALATAGYGTALGVIRGAVEAGKPIRVLADETRPVPPGRAADRVGARARRDPRRDHHRQHGRPLPLARRDRGRRRRRRPHRRQRRRRQQDRHVRARRAREGERRPVLRRRADDDGRPRVPRRRGDPDRGAPGLGGPHLRGPGDRARRRRPRATPPST